MEISEYKNIFENEETHFFYVGNHNVVLSLVASYFGKKKGTVKILDAGCGTGLLAKKLGVFGRVEAVDISPQAVKFAQKRGVKVRRASVTDLPFVDGMFDLVVSVDVIYHKMVDDKKALAEFFRVLKPGGILLLRVPANKWLRLVHDRHVHTRQRYSALELKEKLKSSGFLVEKISFVNLILLPLASIRYLWERISPPKEMESGVEKLPLPLNRILAALVSVEGPLLSLFSLPFGLGLLAVGRKPLRQRSSHG